MDTHTIDAKGRRTGMIATEAARYLIGKNSPDFAKNKAPNVAVHIVNASHIAIDKKKLEQKTYTSYSGYPGGLKNMPIKNVIAKKGYKEILRKAVKGMLPKNKLQKVMMNNLRIEE